ncbi:hypothetical protein BWQ96_04940 [Gracilariopsis chorda]|uniref:Uncharacterized protein n=1 Tax=Gracilariopsis chorda TaxID=448386 RepID=A0A2V3IT71_9FLOR|nr:hypothetical protein BWQ96_04940 [Gracilariopsis chorda]|eukprot:PXF45299.1 hypothetical protein BWQ96_04940 [Gracilariopsis chorda]
MDTRALKVAGNPFDALQAAGDVRDFAVSSDGTEIVGHSEESEESFI